MSKTDKKQIETDGNEVDTIEIPEYRAKLRYVMISAQKVRPFANLIRGINVDEALNMLQCYPNRGARILEKVLKSALSNAENLEAEAPEDLCVAKVLVDEGPMQRRWKAGSRGVSSVIQRKMSHVTIVLSYDNFTY